jgi:hypothetical protein
LELEEELHRVVLGWDIRAPHRPGGGGAKQQLPHTFSGLDEYEVRKERLSIALFGHLTMYMKLDHQIRCD